ncbi:MAG: carbon-nitrogen family hydrolase [Candidatus Eremiobacteraeota bacterium]|nr:carbon-nitrogen family hydrolase [Candidatus Eremiobacteraeota bacterium]
MQVLAVQTDIVWEEPQANFDRVTAMLAQARPQPGDLVVLPEMFAWGFSMNTARVTEDEDGPTATFLAETARRLDLTMVGGVPLRHQPRPRNAVLVYSPTGRVVRYDKRRPFTFGEEGHHYEPGRQAVWFQWNGFRVAPLICYDLRFPELFRELALDHEIDMFVVPANWPSPRVEHWQALLKARAIENQAVVVGVNRCGQDPSNPYPGCSMMIDEQGRVVAEAGSEPVVLRASFGLDHLRAYRQRFPALVDGRSLRSSL